MKDIIKLLREIKSMSDERFNKINKTILIVGILFGSAFFINALAHLLGK